MSLRGSHVPHLSTLCLHIVTPLRASFYARAVVMKASRRADSWAHNTFVPQTPPWRKHSRNQGTRLSDGGPARGVRRDQSQGLRGCGLRYT